MNAITILIPTYNRSSYLEKAIRSALSQHFENISVIVSDNASTDDTAKLCKIFTDDPRFTYFRHSENIGMVRNWRYALDNLIKTEYVLILSDDDELIDDNYLADVSCLLDEHACDLIFSNGKIEYVDSGKFEIMQHQYVQGIQNGDVIALSKESVKPLAFTLCNVVFNVETLKKLNAFSNQNNLICDSEMFLTICFSGVVGYLNNIASIYRRHSSNLVDTLNKKPEILIGCLDYVATPYCVLCQRNDVVSDKIKKEFYNNSFLPAVRSVFLNLVVTHNYSIKDAASIINETLVRHGLKRYEAEFFLLVKTTIKKLVKLF